MTGPLAAASIINPVSAAVADDHLVPRRARHRRRSQTLTTASIP
jgi:hypothetical protein